MKDNGYSHITDAELLQKHLSSQTNEWLGILLERYTRLLFGVCMKYLKDESEASDSVQQVFLKVIQDVRKYKIDFFKSWLYMVAKNHCLTLLRDKKAKLATSIDVVSVADAEPADLEQMKKEQVHLDLLKEGLGELSPGQKQCVTLFYLDKRSYQEISEQTAYSLLQVKSYIQNGKRNLKLNIERKMKERYKNG